MCKSRDNCVEIVTSHSLRFNPRSVIRNVVVPAGYRSWKLTYLPLIISWRGELILVSYFSNLLSPAVDCKNPSRLLRPSCGQHRLGAQRSPLNSKSSNRGRSLCKFPHLRISVHFSPPL